MNDNLDYLLDSAYGYASSTAQIVKNAAVDARRGVMDFLVERSIEYSAEVPPELKEPLKARMRESMPVCEADFALMEEEFGSIAIAALGVVGGVDPACIDDEILKDEKLQPWATQLPGRRITRVKKPDR